MIDDSPTQSVRGRRRSWRRVIVIALVSVPLVCGGLYIYLLWSANATLRALIAEMDRNDPGWRLQDLEAGRKNLADGANAALQMAAVKKLLGGQSVMTRAIEPLFENLPIRAPLSEKQAAALRERLVALDKAILEARKLKDIPHGRAPITYSADYISTLMPLVWDSRVVCDLLWWDAHWRVHEGDAAGALETCLALFHSAHATGDEPFMVTLLVRYSCNAIAVEAMERTLAQLPMTSAAEPALERLQAALARELADPALLMALRGERAGVHQFVEAFAEGKVTPPTFGARGPALRFVRAEVGAKSIQKPADPITANLLDRFPGVLASQHTDVLRFFNALIEASQLPTGEQEARFQALEARLPEESYLVRVIAPAIIGMRVMQRRREASLRSALAGLAAERFRLAQGVWPDSLEDLVKAGFLEAVPLDPFDGKPLRLKHMADGVIIYSIGLDLIDNGGAVDRERDPYPPSDVGFRLWDDARRLRDAK